MCFLAFILLLFIYVAVLGVGCTMQDLSSWHVDSLVGAHGSSDSTASLTRKLTHIPCVAKWIPNQWTTRQSPHMPSLLKWLFKSFAYGKLDCLLNSKFLWGFPGSSAGKESACNAGDPGSIPGSNPGEGIRLPTPVFLGFPGGSDGKESACNAEDLGLGRSQGWEDPLEKGMTTHSSTLAWRIPRTEEPGGLQSLGSQWVRHDWVTKHLSFFTYSGGKSFLRYTFCGSFLPVCDLPTFSTMSYKEQKVFVSFPTPMSQSFSPMFSSMS